MAEIPRLSYDLIEMLDWHTRHPKFPTSSKGFGNLNEGALRAMAFDAGFRACVDMLLDMRTADEAEADAESNPPEPEQHDPFGTVYGPDGQPHTGVASLHMAGSIAADDNDDGSKP